MSTQIKFGEKHKFDSSSTTFYVISENTKKTIHPVYTTFYVDTKKSKRQKLHLLLLCFPLLINICSARNFNLQAVHNWHLPILLKPS